MDTLERIITQIAQTASVFWTWLSSRGWDPRAWDTLTWLSLVILLLSLWIVGLLGSRAGKRSKRPELMVSKGEVRQREGGTAQILGVKLSNLNTYTVQLLEITLKTEHMDAPLVIDAAELIAAGEAVELEAPLPRTMSGDIGVLHAFVFIPHSRKLYRLQGDFAWEAWAFRYKVSPLGQNLKKVRRLESAKLSHLRKRALFGRRSSSARSFDSVLDTSYKTTPNEDFNPFADAPRNRTPVPEDIMQLLEAKPQPSTLVNMPPDKPKARALSEPNTRNEPKRDFPKDF